MLVAEYLNAPIMACYNALTPQKKKPSGSRILSSSAEPHPTHHRLQLFDRSPAAGSWMRGLGELPNNNDTNCNDTKNSSNNTSNKYRNSNNNYDEFGRAFFLRSRLHKTSK